MYQILLAIEPLHISQKYNNFVRTSSVSWERYQSAFMNINQITNIMKYRDFQYRLLMGTILTNNQLYHWGKGDTQVCEFCQVEKQTQVHLMVQCPLIRSLWATLRNFVSQCTKIKINETNFDANNIMMNDVHPKLSNIINLIVLITKQHIYYCKCNSKTIVFREIVEKIEGVYQMERYNANYQNML